MIYLGNGMYSDSSLSHGGPWKEHKYIRIENGRYIYPSDIKGGLQRSAPPPEIKYKEGRDRHNNRKQEKRLQYTDKYQSGVNSQGPSAAERAQRYYGSNASKNTSSGSNSVKYKKTKDINKNKKYQKSVSSQGPSAAERAQTTRYYSSKINGKWDTPPEAESNNIHGTTRQRMVSYNNKPKGPSAAEMAQRNANGGSRNVEKKPKKKKSVKSAVKSWVKKNIIGAPGKVTTHN